MELIADGGSTKVDWVVLDDHKKELLRVRSEGLNPAIVTKEELKERLLQVKELIDIKEKVSAIYFYGAGCGTPKPLKILKELFEEVFKQASVYVAEDMLAAVYAASFNKESVVCILGTGSNSCYYNGEAIEGMIPSLGYTVMDEASGNYFGKLLLRDYFYKKMPKKMRTSFEKEFDLNPDVIKENLYKKANPNRYLASFSTFMFTFKEEKYIKRLIKKGFTTFLEKRVCVYEKSKEVPVYFIGSIAFYFEDLLRKASKKKGLEIKEIIQRPLDNLIKYHQQV